MSAGHSANIDFIRERIKALREKHQFTQDQLGVLVKEKNGKGCTHFSQIENGRSQVTASTLFALADIFDVSPEYFQPKKKTHDSETDFLADDESLKEMLIVLKDTLGEKGTVRMLRRVITAIMDEHDDIYRAARMYREKNSAGIPYYKHGPPEPGGNRKGE